LGKRTPERQLAPRPAPVVSPFTVPTIPGVVATQEEAEALAREAGPVPIKKAIGGREMWVKRLPMRDVYTSTSVLKSLPDASTWMVVPNSQFTVAGNTVLQVFPHEGDAIVSITPALHSKAVELFVPPVDLPLVRIGDKVRIIFDGWPVFVFSGWPNVSFGTFGGVVVAIDQNVSANGQFRMLVASDKNDVDWPVQIRMGGGVKGILLLKDVPIWYEIWRQLNGFPPDFYEPATTIKYNKNKSKSETKK
jgi:hypothetical protein